MIRLAAAVLALAVPTVDTPDAPPPAVYAPIRGALIGSWQGKCQIWTSLDALLAEHGRLDYRSGGWWTLEGLLVAVAPSEDSEPLCLAFRPNP